MVQVRIAVIGAGLIGRRHIELINAHSSCQLVAISDTDPGCEALANKFEVPFYKKYEELLDEERPEGAIVATPTAQHVNVGLACTERAIVPLIEKPITVTLEEGRMLLESADRYGVPILVGHFRRFNPKIQRVRALVQNGDLGRLAAVNAIWCIKKPNDYFNITWRTQAGGGPVLINLIHEIDCLRYICGEIHSVYAATNSVIRNFEVEDSVSITLEFENGAMGSLIASDAVPSPWSYETTSFEKGNYFHTEENCFYFMGSKASLAFPKMELWHYADTSGSGWNDPLTKEKLSVEDRDPLTDQLSHFYRVIKREETPIISGKDGLRTLAATLAVLESAREKKLVRL